LTSGLRGPHLARLLGPWQSTRAAGGARQPEYAALADAVRGLIRDGRVALSVRLPAERELADALRVSRTTVTAAYRELRASGHLSSRRGAGSWSALPPGQRIATSGLWMPVDDDAMIDLGCAALAAPPQLAAAAAEALADLPRYASGAGYHPTGLMPLREAVAELFSARGMPTVPDQIMITNGVQHAVDLILRLTVSPGQSVLVESPTYPNMITAMRAHRVRLSTDNLDPAAGWEPDTVLGSLRALRPTLAYLIPEFHNPTGHLMPADLREQLVALAHRTGTDLVIDESFVDLPGNGIDGRPVPMPPPVASFDRHARVLTVGGMTKPYWGGLRVGWVRAPAPVISRLAAHRVTVDTAGPVLDQLVALRLLARSDEILSARRRQLTEQRDALVSAVRQHLPGWSTTVPLGGVCLWVELDGPVSTALAQAALAHGVRLAPGPRFGMDGTLERYVRLPFTLPSAQLHEAVRLIAAATAELDRARPAEWSTPALVA
jgi:DNA-binding transcriptional MocR family regulator